MSYPGIPREKLPWFPTINYDVCTSDLVCLNFCPHEVYEWDADTGQPIVAHPNNCVPGCDSCAQLCKAQAITFPSKEEFRKALRRLRDEVRKASQPASGG